MINFMIEIVIEIVEMIIHCKYNELSFQLLRHLNFNSLLFLYVFACLKCKRSILIDVKLVIFKMPWINFWYFIEKISIVSKISTVSVFSFMGTKSHFLMSVKEFINVCVVQVTTIAFMLWVIKFNFGRYLLT